LVGNIQDREMVPEFRAGRMAEGIWRGVAALATRIARDRGVELTGAPAPRAAPSAPPVQIPPWMLVLGVLLLILMFSRAGRSGLRGRRGPPIFFPGGLGGGGGGGGFGGFGGGGGGFGGFGGGGFGGGGAGRGW
jgi:uncharacterized protein